MFQNPTQKGQVWVKQPSHRPVPSWLLNRSTTVRTRVLSAGLIVLQGLENALRCPICQVQATLALLFPPFSARQAPAAPSLLGTLMVGLLLTLMALSPALAQSLALVVTT